MEPVHGDKHHSPETAETTEHADDSTDFTHDISVLEECVPVDGPDQDEHVHGHHSQVTYGQVDDKDSSQLPRMQSLNQIEFT